MNVRAAWDEFWARPILRSRLTALRVAFFGLLGLDLWLLMVPHAPRHADGFNVSHAPALDGLLPDPSVPWFTALYLFAGFLSFRVALGLASRASVILLAVVYNATYFWSQLDSYQHHYLMCLLTVLACFVPWHTLPGLGRARDENAPTHMVSWAARLMYVEVSIVYFFTATTKVTDRWLDGWALNEIIHVEWVRDFYTQVNESMGWGELGMYALVAHAIMLWQFFVAFALPVEGRGLLVALVVPTTLWALWPSKGAEQGAFNSVTHALAHAAIAVLMVASLRASDASYDYYRFWAGDLARRGELTEAALRYERANDLRRGETARHFQLAGVYERLGRPRDAQREYERGLVYEPDAPRGTEGLRRVRREGR